MADLSEEDNPKRKQLERLVKANQEIETSLNQQGVGVQPWVLVNLRLDMILNVLLDEDARYDFEIESANHVRNILMQIQQQVQEQKSKPRLLVPNQNLQVP